MEFYERERESSVIVIAPSCVPLCVYCETRVTTLNSGTQEAQFIGR